MKRLLAFLVAYPLALGAQDVAPGNETIVADELRADLFFLASDEMQGRLTETPGNEIASAFIRSRFERLGLEPMGPGGSFYQPFRLLKSKLPNPLENDLEFMRDDGTTMRAQLRDSFFPLRFSASGSVEAEVVFAGFGIRAPKLFHDDLGEGRLRGKIVLVLDHEPGEGDADSVFNGVVRSEYSRPMLERLSTLRTQARSGFCSSPMFTTIQANRTSRTSRRACGPIRHGGSRATRSHCGRSAFEYRQCRSHPHSRKRS